MVFDPVLFVFLAIPVYVANSTPLLFSKVRVLGFLDLPIDRKKFFMGERLLGDGKTLKGFVLGLLSGSFAGLILGASFLGFLLSLGVVVGDLLGSFIKRRFRIKRGRQWFWDSIFFVVFALVFASSFFSVSWEYWLILLILSPLIHRLANVLAFHSGLKNVKY